MPKWLHSADLWLDRLIGADRLRPHVRGRLLLAQLTTKIQMAPVLLAGSLVVSAALLAATAWTHAFMPMLVWAAAANGIPIHAYLHWRALRDDPAPRMRPHDGRRTCLLALGLGIVWCLPLMVLISGAAEADVQVTLLIAVASMLCAHVLAFANYPQALVAISIPILLSLLAHVVWPGAMGQPWLHFILGVTFLVMTIAIMLRHATNFVTRHISEFLIEEKHALIGLLLREVEQSGSDWTWQFDENGRIDKVSGGFAIATGLEDSALVGADFLSFLRAISVPGDPVMDQLDRLCASQQPFAQIELRIVAGGEEGWWSLTGRPVFDSGHFDGYIGIAADVTDRKAAEARILEMAQKDMLTGLINHATLCDHLDQAADRLDRYGSPFAFALVAIEGLPAIVERFGFRARDRVLEAMGERVRQWARRNETAARFESDLLAIMLTEDWSATAATQRIEDLLAGLAAPYDFDGATAEIGVAAGLVLAPHSGRTADEVYNVAVAALETARRSARTGGGRLKAPTPSSKRDRDRLEADLARAVREQDLVLYFQPQVNADTQRTTGFEALVRWRHEARGLLSPSDFMPLASQSGLIDTIGDWTLEAACKSAAEWPGMLAIAVNLSPQHFRRADIALSIERALTLSGLDARRLEVEVSEAMLMGDAEVIRHTLEDIRHLGVSVVLDDFGMGHWGLAHVLKFTFDKIKIDRALIEAAMSDPVARDRLRAIGALARTMNLRLVAKGVEDEDQARLLSDLACHSLQGFHIAPPLDAEALGEYLTTMRIDPAGLPEPLPAPATRRLSA